MTGEVAYFQTGTYGPASDSVLQAVRETMEGEARHGPATTAADWRTGTRRPPPAVDWRGCSTSRRRS